MFYALIATKIFRNKRALDHIKRKEPQQTQQVLEFDAIFLPFLMQMIDCFASHKK